MSKTKENIIRTADVAKKVVAIIKATALSKLYTIATNENVDKSNRVAIFNESHENAKQIVESMRLQSDFMQAVSRVTVWLDNTQIVVFVGAVFTVFASQSKLESKAEFNKLYNESIDKKYNERKLKNKTITALTETRHTFNSVDDFKTFFNLFSELVNDRLNSTAEQQTTAQQSKAKQNSKAKQSKAEQSKTKIKSATAEQLAELTKEVIESESKNA